MWSRLPGKKLPDCSGVAHVRLTGEEVAGLHRVESLTGEEVAGLQRGGACEVRELLQGHNSAAAVAW